MWTDGRPSPYSVWAPRADLVQLVVEGPGDTCRELSAGAEPGDSLDLVRSDSGWWELPESSELRSIRVENSYAYLVDGAGPFPDPRSRRQPGGVHGFSKSIDLDDFAWTDHSWPGRGTDGKVIYELHLGTFTPEGTLDAAIGKIDYLTALGVDFVELLPVNSFNGEYNWGYDGVLWYSVHEQYGGARAYQRFVDACHAASIGVIQDVVYNHLGPSGNYLPEFGPYLSEGGANTWGSSLNLDGPLSDEVRAYIIDNALGWLRDFHVDGLRLDAVHALNDSRATHLLEELASETEALSRSVGRPLSLIAESDLNDPRMIAPRSLGGYGLTGQWNDDFHHALHVALTGETSGYYADFSSLDALKKTVSEGFFHNGTYSSFRERHHGRPIDRERLDASSLVVFSQDHDQIGNRARGDRLSSSLGNGQLAIAAALTLLGPFTPMLFMGEEWGASTPWQFFTSHPEPELGEATARGRIAEFARMGWDPAEVPDPQDPETFRRSHLDWSESETGRHALLLDTYRAFTDLRRTRPEFGDPRFSSVTVEHSSAEGWLVMHRHGSAVLCAFGPGDVTVPVRVDEVLIEAADSGSAILRRSDSTVTLRSHSVVVVTTRRGE